MVITVAAMLLPLAARSADAAPEPPPAVAPGSDPLADSKAALGPLFIQVHQLYQNSEAATERYNATVSELAQQQSTIDDLKAKVERQQRQVDAGIDVAAQLAAAQYRNGDASGFADLLLSKNPYETVDTAWLLAEASRSQAGLLTRLKSDQSALDSLKKQAEGVLERSRMLAAEQEQAKAEAARQLAAVEHVVSSLTGAQRADLERLEKTEEGQAQAALLASGVLGKDDGAPSQPGRAAVTYALAQIGKPYVWGGVGPDGYDCSGLTSQAWLHAGRPIPRTSQEQWAQLQHVPLKELRPGDLVIYHSGATHVAMYIGGGLVVQAPHAGATVKVSPIGGMPILGTVRPDPKAEADEKDGTWEVPDIPQDTGE
ncbi:C40 family peptidase [Saccharothrix sp. ST-888]|uniref:C40 family peptidase n=1 Tax=Saccharothrix sp. ST-888 TaxID=1427391 RepID=UPI0012E088C9|nr:NlpC/P60 family protein [Saccharothrix sp. ST-888]